MTERQTEELLDVPEDVLAEYIATMTEKYYESDIDDVEEFFVNYIDNMM